MAGPPHGADPVGDPIRIKMLGGSKFRLRQDFCQRQKCLLTRPATEKFPRLWAGGIEFQLAEVALQQALESLAVAGLVTILFTKYAIS